MKRAITNGLAVTSGSTFTGGITTYHMITIDSTIPRGITTYT